MRFRAQAAQVRLSNIRYSERCLLGDGGMQDDPQNMNTGGGAGGQKHNVVCKYGASCKYKQTCKYQHPPSQDGGDPQVPTQH